MPVAKSSKLGYTSCRIGSVQESGTPYARPRVLHPGGAAGVFGVTYYKIKEAIDKLSASGDIVVERRNIDQRKKFVHRKYVPKISQFFGIHLEGF